jgi:uncharacterized membrane protein
MPELFFWIPFIVWELVWKGIAMWKSARHSQLAWFIAILVLNTLGVLPIIYLLFFQKKTKKVKNNSKGRKK